MTHIVSLVLFAGAAFGLLVGLAQMYFLERWRRRPAPAPRHGEVPISILKPLCGVDDDLERNLELFADLPYADYEVVLGVRDRRDLAYPVARQMVERYPQRFRLVMQQGEPGLNPKVNQLIGMAKEARHELLVISDSNVRVGPGYLREIAALFEDPMVALVSHPVAGVGERALGSLLDNIHMTATIGLGMITAKEGSGQDLVVGKSMAFRRADLALMGGMEALKDVLAEDFFMGRMVRSTLGKRVAIAREVVHSVSQNRSLRQFRMRFNRWAVMQRQAVGLGVYLSQTFLNPVTYALLGLLVAREPWALTAFVATCVARMALDALASEVLRPGGFTLRQILFVLLKEVLVSVTWVHGFFVRTIDWRGTKLRVLAGTRLEPTGELPTRELLPPDEPEAEPRPKLARAG